MTTPGPPTTGLRTRSRLLAALDRALLGAVVVISAGPGYGKTCLLSSWASQRSGRANIDWVTAPAPDRAPEISGAAAQLLDRSRATRRPGVLIIDDPAQSWPSPTVEVLVAELAGTSQELGLIVATRDGRTTPWEWLRAAGRLTVVTSRDLAFSDPEAADLLAAQFGVELEPGDLAQVNRHLGGWAQGLATLGEEMRWQHVGPATLGAWPERSPGLASYLAQCVSALSPPTLEFAQTTAWLPTLTPDLCDHITGGRSAAQLLADLAAANMFTEPAPAGAGSFQFHPAFAGFLRQRDRQRDPAAATRVLTRASLWYAEHGHQDLAVEAALRAKDGPRAAALLRGLAGAKLRAGQAEVLVGWLERLPHADLWLDPALALVLGRACGLAGDTLTPRTVLRATSDRIDQLADHEPGLVIARALLESATRGWEGRLATMGEPLEHIPDSLGDLAEDPVLEMCAIDASAVNNGRVRALIMTGRLAEAVAITDRYLTPAQVLAPDRYTVVGVGLRALGLAWSQQVGQAREAVRQGLRVLGRYRGSGTDALWLHLAAAWVADPQQARTSQAAVQGYAEASGLPYIRALAALSGCALELRLDDPVPAGRALAAARREIALLPEPAFLAELLTQLSADPRLGGAPTEPLTEAELAMLGLLAAGATRTQIAAATAYSVNTVKSYLRSAYRKLGATSRDEAVAAAMARGLLEPGTPAG